MPIEWTPERDAELTSRWHAGVSTGRIGRELTRLWKMPVTKNAIVGRARRLGMPARPSPIKRNPNPKPPVPPVVLAEAITLDSVTVVVEEAPMPEPEPLPVLVPAARGWVRREGCSYPIGEPGKPGFRFCDEPRLPGARASYCGLHAAQCHRPWDGKAKAREGWTGCGEAKAKVFGA